MSKTADIERALKDIKGTKKHKKINYKLKAQILAQLYARLRDTDSYGFGHCISCGREASRDRGNWEGGHYFDKNQHYALAAHVDNVHLQCSFCNRYGMNDANTQIRYSQNLLAKIGKDRMHHLKTLAASKDDTDIRAALIARNILPFKFTQVYWESCYSDLLKLCHAISETKNWKVKF